MIWGLGVSPEIGNLTRVNVIVSIASLFVFSRYVSRMNHFVFPLLGGTRNATNSEISKSIINPEAKETSFISTFVMSIWKVLV